MVDLYCSSFERIQSCKVSKDEDVKSLSTLLLDIKDKHSNLENEISKGLNILKSNLDSSLLNYNLINTELDKFFLSRISIRTLITQNSEILKNNSLIKDCNLKKIIDDSCENVNYICDEIYDKKPNIEIKNNKEIILPYIP
jgi:hypothetical protein